MDLQKTAREIGLFEMGLNLSKVLSSADVQRKAGACMPLPAQDIAQRVQQISDWLHGFGKRKYLFLTPELALIEALSTLSCRKSDEAIIAIPCDMDAESKERLLNNLPRSMSVRIQEEPFFDQTIFPGNGMMVVCGYCAEGRAMVLSDTYRLVEHYRDFRGKVVFLPYTELDRAERYDGWMELKPQRLSAKWRSES